MANQKISALTAATTLNDTDDFLLRRGSTNVRISQAMLRKLFSLQPDPWDVTGPVPVGVADGMRYVVQGVGTFAGHDLADGDLVEFHSNAADVFVLPASFLSTADVDALIDARGYQDAAGVNAIMEAKVYPDIGGALNSTAEVMWLRQSGVLYRVLASDLMKVLGAPVVLPQMSNGGLAVGDAAQSHVASGTAVGTNANVVVGATYGTALTEGQVLGAYGTAIGRFAQATYGGFAAGYACRSGQQSSVLGYNNDGWSGAFDVVVGTNLNPGGGGFNVLLGYGNSFFNAAYGVKIGYANPYGGTGSIAIGSGNRTGAYGGAFGNGCWATGINDVSVGSFAEPPVYGNPINGQVAKDSFSRSATDYSGAVLYGRHTSRVFGNGHAGGAVPVIEPLWLFEGCNSIEGHVVVTQGVDRARWKVSMLATRSGSTVTLEGATLGSGGLPDLSTPGAAAWTLTASVDTITGPINFLMLTTSVLPAGAGTTAGELSLVASAL